MARTASYPDFPKKEYEQRLFRLRGEMEQRGLDAIVITNETNHRYFDGFSARVYEIYHYYYFSVICRDASIEPVFLCSHGFDEICKTSWISDIRFWDITPDFYMSKESPGVRKLADVIDDLGLGESVIGMELSNDAHAHMGVEHVLQLRELTPKARWVDSSDAIMAVRAVKSTAEIEKLRRAAEISAEAVRVGFESVRPGMTEWELSQKMASRMFEMGGTDIRYLTNYAGPRRMWADAMPSYYEIQKGDLIQFDGGCMVDGYWCDFKRMCSVGKPSDEDQRHYDIAREGIEAATAVVKAGLPASETVNVAFEVNERRGYGKFVEWCRSYGWQAIGHGLGLDVHERPGLSARNNAPLESNMVICVEPFVTLDGAYPFWEARGKFGLEDVVLVTAEGHEILTSESIVSHDLMIV
jgi:Xaa-Pro aminopeptidase